MKVAILGAGFGGIAAAWDLLRAGHQVTLFEAAPVPGGLASGFTQSDWEWSLEKHYHHIFQTDTAIRELLQEMDLFGYVFFRDTNSSTLYNGQRSPLDSPLALLRFPHISFASRLRAGAVLAALRLLPWGQWLDRWTAQELLQVTMGREAWEVLWEPLFVGKFGEYASQVNAAWFWARIVARSKQLGYMEGGFLAMAQRMIEVLKDAGATVIFSAFVSSVEHKNGKVFVTVEHAGKKKNQSFDQVLVTAPAPVLAKVAPSLPAAFVSKITALPGLGAVTMILELTKPFFTDGIYWLNINEAGWPILAVVEHTNFVSSQHLGNKHLLYIGKYMDTAAPHFSLTDTQLYALYKPYLEKLSPGFSKQVQRKWVFRERFAQPVVLRHHGKKVPQFTTPIPGLWWASMQHVYPFDRGTNFAVQIGRQAAAKMLEGSA